MQESKQEVPKLVCLGYIHQIYIQSPKSDFAFFMPPHRMMAEAYSFSVFRPCVRGYVLLYESVYVRTYIRTYVILLDSG